MKGKYFVLGLAGILSACAPARESEMRQEAPIRQERNYEFRERKEGLEERLKFARNSGVIDEFDYNRYRGILSKLDGSYGKDDEEILDFMNGIIRSHYLIEESGYAKRGLEAYGESLDEFNDSVKKIGDSVTGVRR